MPDSVDELTALQSLEATLLTRTTEVGDRLREPPSAGRRSQIRALWPQIAQHEATYLGMLQRLRGQFVNSGQDTPLQAVARRTLLRYGPTRASLWAKVTGVVSRQMLASSFPPLMSERSEIVRGREFGDVNYLMQALFDLANPLSGDKELLPDTHYRDIPLSGAYFLNLLQAARRLLLAQGHEGPVRFLDVGCGGGTKVLAASAVFDVAHGIELSPEYITQAAHFFEKVGADASVISQGDALQFSDYGRYDVIYFYRPLKDPALAARMEAQVLKHARPGTIILAPLNASLGRGQDNVGTVADKIYLAGTSRKAAQNLGDRAEMCGCETRIAVQDDATELGFWEPIVSQSRRNGFALR